MAFTIKGPVVAGARETTGVQSVTLQTGYATGDVVVVWAGNSITSVAGHSTQLSVTDSKGNSYVRAVEFSETDFVSGSVFYANVTAGLVSGDTVSLSTTSGNRQFQEMAAVGFTIGAGNKATLAGTGTGVAATAVAALSLSIANLPPQDYLWLATIANRNSATPPNISGVGGWALTGAASTTGTTGGTSASGQHINWNYQITNASGVTRAVSGLISVRSVAVIAALKEEATAVAFNVKPTFFQVF